MDFTDIHIRQNRDNLRTGEKTHSTTRGFLFGTGVLTGLDARAGLGGLGAWFVDCPVLGISLCRILYCQQLAGVWDMELT